MKVAARRTRIAFVIDRVYSARGGTEKQLLFLIRNLDREYFEPWLCVLRSSRWLEEEFDPALCDLYRVGMDSLVGLRAGARLLRFAAFLRHHRIDCVQTFFKDANLAGVLAARLAGTPFVIAGRRNQGYVLSRAERTAQRVLDRWVDLYLTNSVDTMQRLTQGEGIAPGRVRIVHNAVDPRFYVEGSRDTRAKQRRLLGLDENALVVGIVANVRPIKSLDVFVRAAARVALERPRSVFPIVGEADTPPCAPEKLRLTELAASLGLAGRIRFLGERDDVAEVLGCFDVAVLSSGSESFSNSLCEYLAAGLPVVTTDVGGARECVEPGVNGFVVPVSDHEAMARAILEIDTQERAEAMGIASRKRARELFDAGAVLARYQEIYGVVPRS